MRLGYPRPARVSERERRGDWLVLPGEAEEAEDAFRERNRFDRAADRATRQPIEPNREVWERRAGAFDYPGVDTPTDEPRYSLLDEHRQRAVSKRREPTDALASPVEDPEWRGSRMLGAVESSSAELGTAARGVWDELGL
jgi:hypothetical protein